MNKTLTIKLGGRIFYVDEDAYKLLHDYLYNLRHAFSHQEGCDEIVDDLENRLAELLQENLNNNQEIVSLQIIEEAINRLGQPNEIAGDKTEAKNANDTDNEQKQEADKTTDEQSQTTHEEKETPPPFTIHKRLFRDPDNQILGGVASGIANYFGWDPTLLRLLMILLTCFYGFFIPIYLICWAIIPLAKTAADKLSMHGEQVTIENIGRVVTDNFSTAGKKVDTAIDNMTSYIQSEKPRKWFLQIADKFISVIGVLLTIALGVIAVLLSPVLLLVLMVVIALLLAFFTLCAGGLAGLYELFPIFEPSYYASSSFHMSIAFQLCLFIGFLLILFCIVCGLYRFVFKWKSPSTSFLKILLTIGIVSLIVCGALGLIGAMSDIHLLSAPTPNELLRNLFIR